MVDWLISLQINLNELDRKIRVGAVSYLNALPLVYGLQTEEMGALLDVSFAYPAKVAARLIDGSIDVGLVPVAIMPELNQSFIISRYCIAASGPVASVCIFSEVPIHQLTHVYLDYQSRTSINLARILLKEFWKHEVVFLPAEEDFIDKINGTSGAVVIGDRALEHTGRYTYKYDLAEAWISHTGLPFVFAAWVANKKLPPEFLTAFDRATGIGLNHLDEIIKKLNFPFYNMEKYYTTDVDYLLDDAKKEAIVLFHQKLAMLETL